MIIRGLFLSALMLAPFLTAMAPAAELLPAGFVHLRAVDPTIDQAIRYGGPGNFTGSLVPGYDAAECVLAAAVAEALKRIQASLKPQGLGLKVFDCYRPARAVTAFVRWAQHEDDRPDLKQRYYPHLARKALFPRYIARRSGHSRGASVDLTLVDLSKMRSDETILRDGCGPDPGGAELDMATGFDCFDTTSQTASANIPAAARKNRQMLLHVMREHGFHNYSGEWWHFTYRPEPYPHTYFDFPVTAPPSSAD